MSVKYYKDGKWKIFPGTVGTPGKDAYIIAQENGYTGTKEEYTDVLVRIPEAISKIEGFEQSIEGFRQEIVDFKEVVTEDMNYINKILEHNYSEVSISSFPEEIEAGVDNKIYINIITTFSDEDIIPITLVLKKDDDIISTNPSLTTYNDIINKDTIYHVVVQPFDSIYKADQLTINAYYPMYFGSSLKELIEPSDISLFNKQPIKRSPSGKVSVDIQMNEFVWLCVPSTMNIDLVLSSGFKVPFEEPINIEIPGKTTYNCYRSTNSFISGTFNGIII